MFRSVILFLIIVMGGSYLQAQVLVPYRIGDKWGFSDTTGKIVVPVKYDLETYYLVDSSNYAIIRLDGKYGIVYHDSQGEIKLEYDEIKFRYSDYHFHHSNRGPLIVRKDSFWNILNDRGKPVMPFKYTHLSYPENYKRIPFYKVRGVDGKYGYIDESGAERIPAIYDDVFYTGYMYSGHTDFRFIEYGDRVKVGALDVRGDTILPPSYNHKFYRIDNSLRRRRGIILVTISIFQEDPNLPIDSIRMIVLNTHYHTLLDTTYAQNGNNTYIQLLDSLSGRKEITKNAITRGDPLGHGYYAKRFNPADSLGYKNHLGLKVLVDSEGRTLSKPYFSIGAYWNGKFLVFEDNSNGTAGYGHNGESYRGANKIGMIDTTGEEVLKPEKRVLILTPRDSIIEHKDDKITVYDKNLNIIIPAASKYNFYENNSWHPIVLLNDAYKYIRPISDTSFIASEKKNSKKGVVTVNGLVIIPFKYKSLAKVYRSNYLIAKRKGKVGVLDSVGNVVMPFKFKKLYDLREVYHYLISDRLISNDPLFKITSGKKEGVVNIKGDIVVPTVFDEVFISEGSNSYFFFARSGENYCMFNSTGKQITDAVYTSMQDTPYPNMVRIGKNWSQMGFINRSGKEFFED